MSQTTIQDGDLRRYTFSELKGLGYGSTDSLRRKTKRVRPDIRPINGAYRLRIDELEKILQEDDALRAAASEDPMTQVKLAARRIAVEAPPLGAEDRELLAAILRGGASA